MILINRESAIKHIVIAIILLLVFSLFNGCASNTNTEQATTETKVKVVEPSYSFDDDGNCYDENGDWVNPEDDMEYWDVDSSAFDQVGYSERTQTLDVLFDNSGWYRYTKITPSLFRDFINAESLGGFYNDYIKGQYPCTDLE